MDPFFSELSYGYSVTQELASGVLGTLKGYPIFPSLKKEGRVGGGYDVELPTFGSPLYLQFKRSYYMTRPYASQWHKFGGRYYKIYLMRQKYSIQHELLIHLELSNNGVYYIAPEFYTDDDLTTFYKNKTVFQNSALFSPSDIAHLPDDDQHYIAFDYGNTAYFCSQEPRIIHKISGNTFEDSYHTNINREMVEIDDNFFEKIINGMIGILEENYVSTENIKSIRIESDKNETLSERAEFAGFLSRAYFDSELFVLSEYGFSQ